MTFYVLPDLTFADSSSSPGPASGVEQVPPSSSSRGSDLVDGGSAPSWANYAHVAFGGDLRREPLCDQCQRRPAGIREGCVDLCGTCALANFKAMRRFLDGERVRRGDR